MQLPIPILGIALACVRLARSSANTIGTAAPLNLPCNPEWAPFLVYTSRIPPTIHDNLTLAQVVLLEPRALDAAIGRRHLDTLCRVGDCADMKPGRPARRALNGKARRH